MLTALIAKWTVCVSSEGRDSQKSIWAPATPGREHDIVQSETTTSAGEVSPGFSITGGVNLEPGSILGILVLKYSETLQSLGMWWDLRSECKGLYKHNGLQKINWLEVVFVGSANVFTTWIFKVHP